VIRIDRIEAFHTAPNITPTRRQSPRAPDFASGGCGLQDASPRELGVPLGQSPHVALILLIT
jgi:hypothetical protein